MTKQDIPAGPVELIVEGKRKEANIDTNQADWEKLNQELRTRGWSIPSVLYAVKGTNGNLYIVPYEYPPNGMKRKSGCPV